MQSSESVKEEFLKDLSDLFKKYSVGSDVTIDARDYYQGYPECGEDIQMIIDIPSVYDSDGNCLRQCTEINLGTYYDGKKEVK
jgi:hypothetical protein